MIEKHKAKGTGKKKSSDSDLEIAIGEFAESGEITIGRPAASKPEQFRGDPPEVIDEWSNVVTIANPNTALSPDTEVVNTHERGVVDRRIDDEETRPNTTAKGKILPNTRLSDDVKSRRVSPTDALAMSADRHRRNRRR